MVLNFLGQDDFLNLKMYILNSETSNVYVD